VSQLIVTDDDGVCVHTTVREANDRGYDYLVPEDCVSSYFLNSGDGPEDDRRAGWHLRLGLTPGKILAALGVAS
jgi:hypothetical protein